MKNQKKEPVLKIVGIIGTIIFIVAIIVAIYMMYHGMGHVEGFDFGPGQYYYTDIPGWQKYFVGDFYDNPVPLWVLIALFFAWGFLMYRLWVFLDKRLK